MFQEIGNLQPDVTHLAECLPVVANTTTTLQMLLEPADAPQSGKQLIYLLFLSLPKAPPVYLSAPSNSVLLVPEFYRRPPK